MRDSMKYSAKLARIFLGKYIIYIYTMKIQGEYPYELVDFGWILENFTTPNSLLSFILPLQSGI